jgi:hypothetical protein
MNRLNKHNTLLPNGIQSEEWLTAPQTSEGKFLYTKFEFGGSFGMSLEGDCHKVEATPNLELLVTFGMSLEGVCQELYTYFHNKLTPNLEVTKNFLKKIHS